MEFENLFSQDEELNQIVYLVVIFGLLNEFDVSLQCQSSSMLYDEIKYF
jgi:hypothetical protein